MPNIIDMPMPILTPRLLIRPVMPGDGAALTEAKLETLDRLNPWLPFAARTPTVAEDEETVRIFYKKYLTREDFMLAALDRRTGRLIGCGGLHPLNWPERVFSSGYWVRKSEHGRRYASEINNAIIRYAFNRLDARRMEIFHAEGNVASESIIRRLGYVLDHILPKGSTLTDGTSVDKHGYVRLNADNLPPLDVRW